MECTVIITAGGTGKRMGGPLPKQFLLLAGKPVLFHTLNCFHTFDPAAQLILSLPEDWISHWQALCTEHGIDIPHEVVAGGKERFHSIQNALALAQGKLIAVHDGVRPLVSAETIQRCFDTAAAEGTAVPVAEVKESLREVSGTASKALIRSHYRLVQTPQVFRSEIIRSAYTQAYHDGITDDASLVEANGTTIALVEGNEANIKITTSTDLMLAELLIQQL